MRLDFEMFPSGMPAEAHELPRTRALIEQGIESGLHIGAQAYVSIRGQAVATLAMGESRPGIALTADTLMLWLSSTKPVAAVAIMQLIERKLLALDDSVAAYIPEFGNHEKASVTIRHLLTHTVGFQAVDINPLEMNWDTIIERICDARLQPEWPPGQRAGYQPSVSWYILGELVRRTDGRHFSAYARQEIFEKLGMRDSWVGMPVDVYRAYGDRIALMPEMRRTSRRVQRYSTEAGATACVPGGNGYGPMRELAMLYEMLLGGGMRSGVRILSEASVEQMTARQRVGMFDETFRHTMDWGLGLIINSNRYGPETVPYGYGRHASERAFGHGGSQSSVGFADPEHGLVVAIALNGMPGERKHNARIREINSAIYEDLGLDRRQ